MLQTVKFFYFLSVLHFLVTIFSFSDAYAADKKIRATLIRQDILDPFWDMTEQAMVAASKDLNIELTTLHTKEDPFRFIQKVKQVVRSKNKPDIVFFSADRGNVAEQAIRILNNAEIDIFIINTGIEGKKKESIGKPREKYKHWIGQMLPDDFDAGERLMSYLYEKARINNVNSGTKIHTLAIQGNRTHGASIQRLKAVHSFVEKHDNLILTNVREGYWREAAAEQTTAILLKQHPETQILWVANDRMAMGAVKAIQSRGLKPGEDIYLAGIDWLPKTFDYIKEGTINASLGGHYMEGAWAMVLAYDYLNGYDFAEKNGVELYSTMQLIDEKNIGRYATYLQSKPWNEIDFKALTKTHNLKNKSYNFNLLKLLP